MEAEWTKTVLRDGTDDDHERHAGMNGPMAVARHHSGRGGGADNVTCAQTHCVHTQYLHIQSGRQRKCVHDSDTIFCCMSERVNTHQTRTWYDRCRGNVWTGSYCWNNQSEFVIVDVTPAFHSKKEVWLGFNQRVGKPWFVNDEWKEK